MNSDKHTFYYPIPASGINGFLFSLVFGLFITYFLWFFEPFNINIQDYSLSELIFFGFISFGVFFTAHTLLPLVKSNVYKESSWTIYSQIIFYIVLFFVIATFNGLYVNFRNNLSFSWANYLEIITQTIAVGIIPITVSVLLSYFIKYKRIAEQSNFINQRIDHTKTLEDRLYTIQSNIKKETFVIDEMTFLFAKSSGNYIEIFVSNDKPTILRMGLLNLEDQLASNNHMMRCHRSYFVNTKQIIKVTGNAQGLKLWFKDQKINIPVSRKYLDDIKAAFAKY